ncbi:hypothetical protein [Streptomyces sp. NBC_01314]|uniref:hypothetical protein n=1 Tax=Streptomyces sp. NBC_01314 TaxID=2903821 RepID=UPI003091BA84|nr:hypothetical protein OG622_27270 [Streptomyces sp. NBC_01314]
MSKEPESGDEGVQATPPHHVLSVSPAGSSQTDETKTELCASADVVAEAHSAPEGYTVETADLDRAFWWLRRAVTQLKERGARVTAAGVKSEVLRLTAFRENDLGFTSFRSFLEAAERAGVVTLALPAPGSGQDVTVSLDVDPASETATRRSGPPSRRRIRPDLWTAFVDWNQKFVRLWDRSAERAVIFPAAPSAGDMPTIARLRDRYLSRPDDFVLIEPISQEQQLGWMRDFAKSVSSEAADLQRCLDEPRPAASFARTLRGDPALGEAWRSQLSSLVFGVIETWVNQNGLHVDPGESLFGPGQQTTQKTLGQPRHLNARSFAEHQPAVSSGPRETDLRAQLLAVLSELSTDELMQIKVPIVYALRP